MKRLISPLNVILLRLFQRHTFYKLSFIAYQKMEDILVKFGKILNENIVPFFLEFC